MILSGENALRKDKYLKYQIHFENMIMKLCSMFRK